MAFATALRGFWAAIGFGLALASQAAVTPYPVGPSGVTNSFDALPTLASGWTTMNWGSANTAITNTTQMDAAARTNNTANIVTAVSTDTTVTNSMTSVPNNPAGTTCFRWNSPGHFVASRPTSIAYGALLGTFVNSSGTNRQVVAVGFDYYLGLPTGASIDEDAGLAGFRVYYSTNGAPGSWQHMPEFDGTNAGFRQATLNLSSPWRTNDNFYLLWVDDNAVNGSSGDTGTIEGPNYMDNVAIWFPNDPVSIVTQPHSVTVETCRRTNLSVTVAGTLPQYQWFHDGNSISGATNVSYDIPSAQFSDVGSYFVRVHNGLNSVDSNPASVTVVQDTNAPVVVRALARCDGSTIWVGFSERMDTNQSAGVNQAAAYHLSAVDGGTNRAVMAAVATNGTNAILILDGPLSAAKHYQLSLGQNVVDCSGNVALPGPYPLQYELCLLSFEGTAWKYYTNSGENPVSIDWRSDPGFDDSGWADGVALFDAKNQTPPRTNIAGFAVMTELPLHDPGYQSGLSNIPVYLFRTHFNLPTAPARILSLNLCTVSDDFDVAWFNGDKPQQVPNGDTPVHIRMGLPATVDPDSSDYSGGTAVVDAVKEGPFAINPSSLVYGDNLICVKEFQVSPTSSDITFAYELVAIVDQFKPPGPRLSIAIEGSNVHITWTPAEGMLYQAGSPDAKGSDWSAVAGQTAGDAVVAETGSAMFFTVRQ